MKFDLKFPPCPYCGGQLEDIWCLEEEKKFDGFRYYKTGRTRWNINYLRCCKCGHKELVDDDTFAEPWEGEDVSADDKRRQYANFA